MVAVLNGASASDADFEAWYIAEYPRLVGSLAIIAGDRNRAAECAMEAFARAYERWDRVSGMEARTGWLYRVACNLVRRHHRRQRVERALMRRLASEEAVPPASLAPEVWSAVRALPSRQRAVLVLRVIRDLPQEEVARILGIRPGTVSATLVAARQTLQAKLGAFEARNHLEVDRA